MFIWCFCLFSCCREYPCSVSNRVYPERKDPLCGSSPEEFDPLGLRCVLCASPTEQVEPRADHVPLHQQLHCFNASLLAMNLAKLAVETYIKVHVMVYILVARTEDGVMELRATFSACFGAPFIMLHPTKYAAMYADKMHKLGATRRLVNSSWSGGRYRL